MDANVEVSEIVFMGHSIYTRDSRINSLHGQSRLNRGKGSQMLDALRFCHQPLGFLYYSLRQCHRGASGTGLLQFWQAICLHRADLT